MKHPKKLSNKKLKEFLTTTYKICNTYLLAGKGGFIITRISRHSVLPSRYAVTKVGFSFKDAPWYDNGSKTFTINSREQEPQALEAAKKWGSKYGSVKEWIKSPFGGWIDKECYERRIKELLQNKETVKD